MRKAMVLGAGGWLGERLAECLIEGGRDVICVDVRPGEIFRNQSGVEVIEADIRDLRQFASRLNECSVVFNCCGAQHPKSTSEIYSVNCDAPVAVYKECIKHGVDSFVHVSSINVHGANRSATAPIDETQPLHPITHYGVSKAKGERELGKLVEPGETRLIILRPGVFYGVHPSSNMVDFMEKMLTTRLPLFSQRGLRRTYVDVGKVVDALMIAEHRGCSGEAYLIGDREPLDARRFYEVMADELGCKLRTVRIPLFVASVCRHLAFLVGRLGPHLRVLTIAGEFGSDIFCSSAKAEHDLGWSPHQSSEDGLRRMVRSVQNK